MDKKGKVYLIGAGPGDPGLLTIKGKDALSKADVVVYDNLANPFLLRYAKKGADLIYVGKRAGKHALDQGSINQLLVKLSKKGLNVARLKGGDPFIFGRGGEEALALFREDIEFEIIPGITSAISVPAYAGIPLTHREYASSVTFVTGHEADSKQDSNIAWDKIIGSETIVILMGVSNIKNIKERLIREGLSPDTPFAIIRNGTLPEQKVLEGRLKDMDEIAEKDKVSPPAIIVIGRVVELRKKINWLEKKPLFGKRILITRPKEQADELIQPLMEMGAYCIPFPTIEIAPPDSWGPLDTAINRITDYDWILFTSVNGVRSFFNRLKRLGNDARSLHGLKIGAIGPKTASLLGDMYIKVDLIPEEYRAEGIATYFASMDLRGMRFLIPRAEVARDYLPARLREMGAKVDVVPAYKTVVPDVREEKIKYVKDMLLKGKIDLAIFTSPSTFKNLLVILRLQEDEAKRYFHNTRIACIGPVTGSAVEKSGLSVDISPERYTIPNLIKAILKD